MWSDVKVGDTLYVLNSNVTHTLKEVEVVFIDSDMEYMSCSYDGIFIERFYKTADSLCWESVNSVVFQTVEDYAKYVHRKQLLASIMFELQHKRVAYDVVCAVAKELGVYKER